MTIKLLPKAFKFTSRPVFTMLFTIKLSDCQTVTVKAILMSSTFNHVGAYFKMNVAPWGNTLIFILYNFSHYDTLLIMESSTLKVGK